MTVPGAVTNRRENRPRSSSWTSQARRFGASGVVNTLTDYVVFMLLTRIFSIPLNRVWTAKLVSGGLAMVVSFLLNRRWVFASRDAGRAGQVMRFLVTTISGSWGIQLGLTQLFSSVWPAPGLAVSWGISPTYATEASASLGCRLPSPNAPICSIQVGDSPSASLAAIAAAASKVSDV